MLETVDFNVEPLSKEDYKPAYDGLMQELILLQQRVRQEGKPGVVVLFEGWGGAGKGSRISDLMYNLDARATTVHVTKDIDEEGLKKFAGRKYGVTGFYPDMSEFWEALGERGSTTIFDRGWYTTAVERDLFDTYGSKISESEAKELEAALVKSSDSAANARGDFHNDVLGNYRQYAYNFERMLVADGYVVVKFFVHVTEEMREKRIQKLYDDPSTRWRVSEFKYRHTKDYKREYVVYDRLLEGSNFDFAPWTLVNGEDKRRANLLIAQTLVDAIERALDQAPDAAAEAAAKAALKNSASQMMPEGEGQAAEEQQPDADAVRAQAEVMAKEQQSLAPKSSKFIIMAGYPQIDHDSPKPSLDEEEYRVALKREQKRLAQLENEMYQKRVPLILMFEGWDAAGKGGAIKRVAQALDARAYTIFPSPAPTKPELAHPHLWRYWTRLPKAGHVGIYDRSWYGRVLVERIEGFASTDEWARAYDEINEFEYELVQWGALLLKFWVDVTPDEQLARFKSREADPARQWKITDEDWRNRDKYPQYKAAVNDMFRLTSTTYAPWVLLDSNDKLYARVKVLQTVNDALEARLRDK